MGTKIKRLKLRPARTFVSRGIGALRLWVFGRFACGSII